MNERIDIENPREVFEREGRLFNHIVAMYQETRGFDNYWQNRRKDLVLKEMAILARKSPVSSLLDVGCAEGLFVRKAVDFGFKQSIGLDLSHEKLIRAKENSHSSYETAEYVLGSSEKLPFKDDALDVTLLSRVLELVPRERQCLEETHRVTRMFFILVTVSAHPTPLDMVRLMLRRKRLVFTYDWGAQARFYYLTKLTAKLRRYWKIEKAFGICSFTHLINPIIKNPSRFRIFLRLDDILEAKPIFRFFGHDIFILSEK